MKGMKMNRRVEVASTFALLSALLCSAEFLTGCCGDTPCQNTGPSVHGPSTGEIVGFGVGIGAATAVAVGTVIAVKHSHHNLKGCVSSGPEGLKLANDSDKKTYSLLGASADLKAGEKVKLHGTKENKRKDRAGNQEFLVDKVTKDLGPCEVVAESGAAPSRSDGR
jgi:hypothetical protein